MSKPKLGSGKRFANLKKSIAAGGAKNPGAVVASIGMKKYGKKKMLEMARKGKARKAGY